jgi:phosphate transport system substrate-binding protein
MKKRWAGLLAAGLLLGSLGCGRKGADGPSGTVSISGAWALYPMVLKWKEEFQKLHPDIEIDVQAGGAGKGIADSLTGMVDLGMVSRDVRPEEVEKGARPYAVAKDAVVATVSSRNPHLGVVRTKGISRAAFVEVWIDGRETTWGRILGTSAGEPVHVFTRSDACGAAETWAAYLGKRQEDLAGVGVYGDPGLADAVRRDPLGIGFNNVNFAFDAKTLKPVDGLAVVPIDLDGNGSIDPGESFTGTRDELTAAIAGNVYPSPPARELFLVSKGIPERPSVSAFLRWILTDGQAFVAETGYIALSAEKIGEGLKSLVR